MRYLSGDIISVGKPTSSNGFWFAPDIPVGDELGQRSGLTTYGLVARVCKSCGNMQLFLKYFPELEKQKNDEV